MIVEILDSHHDGSRRYSATVGDDVCEFTIERRGRFTFACTGFTFLTRDDDPSPFVRHSRFEPVSSAHDIGWLRSRPRWRRARAACLAAVLRDVEKVAAARRRARDWHH